MARFIALHSWRKEDTDRILEEQPQMAEAAGSGQISGISLLWTYFAVDEPRAFCLWEAENIDSLKRFFEPMRGLMRSEFLPVSQVYPPSPRSETLPREERGRR